MTSLLEPLVSTLQRAREVIAKHEGYLQKNEIRTRNVLVDPVLKALAWDVSIVEHVEVEFRTGNQANQRVDYALLGEDRKPLVLIEAKKLNEDLNSHRTQMLTYCTEVGVRYGILTDGNCWDLYNIWNEAPLDERRELQIILTSREAPIAAQLLSPLWRDFVRSGGLAMGIRIKA